LKKININKNSKSFKILTAIVVAAVVIGLGVAIFSPKSGNKQKNLAGYVVGYLPYYSAEAVDRVDFAALTHLNIAFANPNDSGTLYLEMSDETIRKIVKK